MSHIQRLHKKGFIDPPSFVVGGIQYETMMGSVAYGIDDNTSDCDIYGFCIPPRHSVFPHLSGEIIGFDASKNRFENFQEHHIYDGTALGGRGREYDIDIYSIVKYFKLLSQNNPNIIDSLFTPQRCVLFITKIGNLVRENRKVFLHKGAFHRFKGYSYSQKHKIETKQPAGKRKEIVEKYGYDTKYATHLVRLLNEIEQILIEGDLDLTRNREQLKSVRRGEWSLKQINDYFEIKERSLEGLYVSSSLPYKPDMDKIKKLLLNCLEEYYGSLDKCIHQDDKAVSLLRDIYGLLNNNLEVLK